MIEANKYKLGIFVIIGAALFMTALFLLGIAENFQPKVRFVTLFDESVQGLEAGTPVKFRGVSVGKVTNVSYRYSDNYIRVDMESLLSSIDPDSKKYSSTSERAEFFKGVLMDEAANGLRCRLAMSSIATGLKFVELDYFDPKKCPPPPVTPPEGILYIPSTKSVLANLSTDVSIALAKISSVDYEQISKEIVTTFKTINERLNDPKINNMIERFEKIVTTLDATTENVNNALSEARLKQIVDEVADTIKSINELSKTLKKEVDAVDLPHIAVKTEKAISDTAEAAKSITATRKDVSVTIDKLNEAIDSFTEFVNYLEEDPSSVIRGKQKPPRNFE